MSSNLENQNANQNANANQNPNPNQNQNNIHINTDMQRLNYTQAQDQAFREEQLDAEPFSQFQKWFAVALASKMPEPYAMVVSTVDAANRPHSRVVLMRDFTEQGLVFYTNYDSLKGQNLNQNSAISVLFFWQGLEQQVRIEGVAERLSADENQAYFSKRPKGSQIAAMASPQSQKISKSELEQKVLELDERYKHEKIIPCPANWGGYLIRPHYFEFWQGGASRLHDRMAYTKTEKGWVIDRLAP